MRVRISDLSSCLGDVLKVEETYLWTPENFSHCAKFLEGSLHI